MTTTINNEHKKLNVPNSTDKGNVIRNVPHLRFPEFEGEWEKQKLCDISSIVGRIGFRGYTTNDIVEKGMGAIALSPTNIVNNQLTYDKENTYISMSKYEESPEIMIKRGDVIFVKTGSTVGKVAYVDKMICKTTLNPQVVVLKDIKCDNYILSVIMSTRKFQNKIQRITVGGAVPTLSQMAMGNIFISLPAAKEQEKISKFISLLDERIATQSKIIEDLKKLKSAISHILFSSKGAIHLSEIANVVMGQSPSSNAYNDQGLGMPLVQGNLDISNGKTTPRLYTAEFNQTTEKGNIILTVRAPVGEVAKATQKVCLGRGVCAIIPHEENMSDFIYQYLTFYKFMWRRYEQGSTFTSINGSDVRNIFCPKVRNVSILTLLDIKINIEERVVKQYQSQKQYMLYQMFI